MCAEYMRPIAGVTYTSIQKPVPDLNKLVADPDLELRGEGREVVLIHLPCWPFSL